MYSLFATQVLRLACLALYPSSLTTRFVGWPCRLCETAQYARRSTTASVRATGKLVVAAIALQPTRSIFCEALTGSTSNSLNKSCLGLSILLLGTMSTQDDQHYMKMIVGTLVTEEMIERLGETLGIQTAAFSIPSRFRLERFRCRHRDRSSRSSTDCEISVTIRATVRYVEE